MEENLKQDISEHEAGLRFDELLRLSNIVHKFMKVERSTLHADGKTHETDGEHTLHVMFLAVMYAKKYHPELDSGRVAEFVMIHDLVEVYAGDTESLTADPKRMKDKEEQEEAALQRLEEELGDTFPGVIELIREYESLESKEAQFVKAFEKIDPAFSHIANQGAIFSRLGVTSGAHHDRLFRASVERTLKYANPDLVKIREVGHQRTKQATTYKNK